MNKLFIVLALLCSPMMAGDNKCDNGDRTICPNNETIGEACNRYHLKCESEKDAYRELAWIESILHPKPLTIRWVKVKPMLGPVCLAYWSKEGIDGVPKGMGGKCSHTAENPSDDYMGNAIKLGLRSDGIVVWK